MDMFSTELNKAVKESVEKIKAGEQLKNQLIFTRPAEDKYRIGQDIKMIDEYDLIDETGPNRVLGHHEKRFVRLHKSYFSELFASIKSDYPHSSYVTYLNDEDVASGIVPNNISVLLKQMNSGAVQYIENEKQLYNELLGSRIMNYFECKTVYNEVREVGDNEYVFSVDFVKSGEQYTPLNFLNSSLDMDPFCRIEDNMKSIEIMANYMSYYVASSLSEKTPKFDIQKIKEDYLYTYLVRVAFLGDIDYCTKNCGFIYNEKTNEFYFGPTLDFEYCFFGMKKYDYNAVLKYAYENYPHLYDKFISYVEKFAKRNLFLPIRQFETFIKDKVSEKQMKEEYIQIMKDSINSILQAQPVKSKNSFFGRQQI